VRQPGGALSLGDVSEARNARAVTGESNVYRNHSLGRGMWIPPGPVLRGAGRPVGLRRPRLARPTAEGSEVEAEAAGDVSSTFACGGSAGALAIGASACSAVATAEEESAFVDADASASAIAVGSRREERITTTTVSTRTPSAARPTSTRLRAGVISVWGCAAVPLRVDRTASGAPAAASDFRELGSGESDDLGSVSATTGARGLTPSRAFSSSAAFWNRASGSFASSFATIDAMGTTTPATSSAGMGGASVVRCSRNTCSASPWNGAAPVMSSKTMTPSE
jgi:hypothetical protein